MPDLPTRSNFHGVLETGLSREQIANLFAARGWTVRKYSFTDFEIACPWAELVIEADAPMLLHGAVADVLTHVEDLVAPLREARISFRAECYGPEGKLLREVTESGH